MLLLVGVAIGIAGDRWVLPPKNGSEGGPRSDAGRVVPAGFSRVGDRIVVPASSMLRARLALDEPTMKEVSHTLVLPAVVEADPARTVKVMPPVTGRIIDLMAQLGGRVVMGDDLALIDSSDLAAAISDQEKARSALKLARQTLDRLMMLEKSPPSRSKSASRRRAISPRPSRNWSARMRAFVPSVRPWTRRRIPGFSR